jgi:tRNA(adenine34) deaminase
MYFEARHLNTLDFVAKAYRDDITIEGGILRNQLHASRATER